MSRNGFTLIELTVVLVIIGILASIVLVQFPGAIKKAKDSKVISSMAQLRTQALIFYTNRESYANLDQDSTVEYLSNDIEVNSGEDLTIYINNNGQGFCAVAHLQGSGRYFCIDGELHAKEYGVFPDPCSLSCQGLNNCRCE